MKRISLVLTVLFFSIFSFAQSKGYLKYDTVIIKKDGGNAELVILNATKDSVGFLFNKGGGKTEFRKIKQLDAATYLLGGDTLRISTQVLKTDPQTDSSFEIDIFPDIQNMVRHPEYQAAGRSMFEWVRSHKDSANIKAVFQVGDITDWNQTYEWDTASHWFNIFDTINIPYYAAIGNHDYDGLIPRKDSSYNASFGLSRFQSKSWWGGYFNTDPSNQRTANSYIKFDVGKRKYFLLNLEFLPRDTVVNWAGKVLDSLYNVDPAREVMILTHAYIDFSGERATDTSVYSTNWYGLNSDNSGQKLWDKLIKLKPNIKWVFNGHYLIPNTWARTGLHGTIVSTGVNGNLINQVFVNYQDDTAWGNGYFMRLNFIPTLDKVNVSFYTDYYKTFDPRYSSFSLDDPEVRLKSSLALTGNASIYKDLRVSGAIKSEALNKHGVLYVGNDHLIRESPNLKWNVDSGMVIRGSGYSSNFPVVAMYKGDSATSFTSYFDFRNKDSSTNFQIRGYWLNKTYGGGIFIGDSSGANVVAGSSSLNGISTVGIGWRALSRLTTGYYNTAIGNASMQYLTTGHFNTCVGQWSMPNVTTGDDNTVIGEAAMLNVTTASSCTVVGSNAMQNMNGIENTVVGKGALGNAAGSGSQNTALGRSAGRDATGSGNVFLGYFAGVSETGSNKLYISNSSTSSPLIYGEFDNQKLKINGSLSITQILNLAASTAPTSSSDASGVDGDVRRDASGNIYLKVSSTWYKFTGTTF